MFSSWWYGQEAQQTNTTKFARAEEFKQINALIKKLQDKNKELEKAKNAYGIGTVDYFKWIVISRMMTDMESKINAYNAAPDLAAGSAEEKRDKAQLCQNLYAVITQAASSHFAVVNARRNNKKAIVQTAAGAGLGIGAVAAGVTVPLTYVGSGILTYFVTLNAGKGALNALGVTNNDSQTVILLDELASALNKTKAALRFSLGDAGVFNPVLFESSRRASRRNQETGNNTQQRNSAAQNVTVAAELEVYHPAMEPYLLAKREKISRDGNNIDTITALNLTSEEERLFVGLTDSITLYVCNLPVRLNGNLHDLDSLLALATDANGARKDPVTNYLFYPRDLQPAWDVADKIDKVIEDIKAARSQEIAPERPSL